MAPSALAFVGAAFPPRRSYTGPARAARAAPVRAAASAFAPSRGLPSRAHALPNHKPRARPGTSSRRVASASVAAAESGALAPLRAAGATLLSLCATIGAELLASRALRARGVMFPGSLAAMLALLAVITLLRVLRLTRAAEGVRGLFAPGAAFLARWLAVFFVPNLVMLPLAPRLPGADVAKIAVVLVAGLLASLLSTAGAALLLRSVAARAGGGGGEDKTDKIPDPPKPAPPSQTLIVALGVAAAASLPLAAASGASAAVVTLYMLAVTLLAFCVGQRVPRRVRAVVHPLVSCTAGALAGVAALAALTGAPFGGVLTGYYVRDAGFTLSRWGAGNILAALLGPAVVSFAVQMDGRRALMRERGGEVVGTAFIATVVGLFGTAGAARALRMSHGARLMVVPRMITAPLALAIVDMIGAEAGLALSIVAVTGLLGANIAAPLLSLIGVNDPVVRGLATGAAAHGLGTAAMADEPAAFPFAAVAMTLVGIFSTCFVAAPPVRALLLRVALGAAAKAG